MDFDRALIKLREGKKVRCRQWDKDVFLQDIPGVDTKAYLHSIAPFIYDISIISSDKWVEVGKEDVTYLFSDAIKLSLENKKIKIKDWPDGEYLEITKDRKDLCKRKIVEHYFVPSFECFISNDWEFME